jgi:glycine/D-amino acid oxidase-like deaminating enzyme
LEAQNVSCERLSAEELQKRFPQFSVENIPFAVYEPHSGVLLARRAVAAVLEAAIEGGVEYRTAAVMPPDEPNRISALRTSDGGSVEGETFIFACGSWLPKVFPALLGERIFPTRQEVFYFGAPAGANEFRPPAMPTWLDHEAQMYGMPDIESRGLKIACDRHGQSFDPDAGERLASEEGRLEVRTYLQQRFPGLPEPRVVETRVCQYENTCNGDFLLDRHPEFDNVWLAGGGSGHGFKHGPMVGEYMAGRILDGAEAEGRFSCAAKLQVQARSVF